MTTDIIIQISDNFLAAVNDPRRWTVQKRPRADTWTVGLVVFLSDLNIIRRCPLCGFVFDDEAQCERMKTFAGHVTCPSCGKSSKCGLVPQHQRVMILHEGDEADCRAFFKSLALRLGAIRWDSKGRKFIEGSQDER